MRSVQPAIFGSKYRNYTVVMETAEKATKDDPGKKGKRLKFYDGQYKTTDPKEAEFLKRLAQEKTPFRDIHIVQDLVLPDQNKGKNQKGGNS